MNISSLFCVCVFIDSCLPFVNFTIFESKGWEFKV